MSGFLVLQGGSHSSSATGQIDAAGTSSAAFSGTSTASSKLDAAGTSSAQFTDTATDVGTIDAAGTAAAAFAGTSSAVATLAAAGTASVAFAGTSTASANLNTAGVASAAFAGSATDAGTMAGDGTSSAAFAASPTATGSIDAAGTSSAAFAGTATAVGVIDAVGTSSAAFTQSGVSVMDAAGTSSADFPGSSTVVEVGATAASGSSGTTGQVLTWAEVDRLWEREHVEPAPVHIIATGMMGVEATSSASMGGSVTAIGWTVGIAGASAVLDGSSMQLATTAALGSSSGDMSAGVLYGPAYVEARIAEAIAARVPQFVYQPIRVRADAVPDAALRTARETLMRRVAGLGHRRYRMPRQKYPHLIETEYAKALLVIIDRARPALRPLLDELPRLLASAQAERGDRMDAGEPQRVRDLIAKVQAQIEQATRPSEIEGLARTFADRTQTYQRVQLGRQVRAALGADVFASDHRIVTLRDHFVHENAQLISTLPRDIVDGIAKAATRAFTSGTSSATLAAEIEHRFDVGESHARLIARDQVGKLYGQTNAYRQQDLGVESFIWRTAGDERVREEHEALDGQEFSYDDPPDEGLPGEPIQCRCYAEPVFKAISDAIDSASDTAAE